MRARRSVIALVAALGLVLSACGGGDGGQTTSGDQTTTSGDSSASATKNQVNTVARDKVPEGGTLKWAISEMPPNFNANELDGTLRDNSEVMSPLLPSMFNSDSSAELIPNKDYITSAELTAKEPKQVVTYKINPKAIWYDGSPITWADFEAQWKALSGANEAFKVASTQGYDKIESVAKGADDREVIVTYKQPYVDWKGLFGLLYPASTNNDPAMFNDGWKGKIHTAAGPFKFESLDQTAQTVTLVRNEKWWGRKAKLDKIIYRVIDPDAQIDALANGEIDFIDVGPDVNKLSRATTTSGVKIYKAGGPNFRHITINSQSEVLKDANVRKALGLAIDRDTIAKALLGPLGVPAKPLNNHIFMSNQKGYKDNADDLAKADLKKAGSLLDAAGWKLSGGEFRTKDGKELAIRFVIPTQVASSKQESELVQGMLKGLGVKINIEAVPGGDFFEKFVTPGNFDFTVFSWIGTVFPVSSAKSIYANPKTGADGQVDVQQNYARVGSAELDALFDKATSEFDETKALEIGNQIDGMIWDEVHSLTLYQRPEIIAARSNLANFGAFGFASAYYEDFGFTQG